MIIDPQLDHNRSTHTGLAAKLFFKELFSEEGIKPSCLGSRPGKAVPYKSAPAIGFPQPPGDNSVHQLVRNKLAAIHDRPGLKPKPRSPRHVLPQQFPCRYLRYSVALDNLPGLRALAGPWGSEKNHRANVSRSLVCHSQLLAPSLQLSASLESF